MTEANHTLAIVEHRAADKAVAGGVQGRSFLRLGAGVVDLDDPEPGWRRAKVSKPAPR